MHNSDFVELAVITAPHGVSGRVKVKSFTEPPAGFASYEGLRDVNGKAIRLRITGEAQGQFIIEVEGLRDRNEAELWRGRKLGVSREQLIPIVDDAKFYVNDLIGMHVEDTQGAAFGEVVAVHNFGAGDILEIKHGANSDMYAFTNATFPSVDSTARRIIIAPPEVVGNRAEESAGE